MKKEITVGARAGGNSNNGGNAGPFNLNSNNSPANANANIGASLVIFSMLLFSFRKENISLPGNGVLVTCR